MFEPFLKETFCLVGKDLVSGKSYPINIFHWLDIDHPFLTPIFLTPSPKFFEYITDKGTCSAKGDYMIEKMDEETIEGIVEGKVSFEIQDDDWDDRYNYLAPRSPLIKTLNELTLSCDIKWKRDNPLIRECCLQYTANLTIFVFVYSPMRKEVFDIQHQLEYTFKWEAIPPSI